MTLNKGVCGDDSRTALPYGSTTLATSNRSNGADNESLGAGLTFPCQYPIKAMGRSGGKFKETVVAVIADHVGPVEPEQVRTRDSRSGTYQSVTVTIKIDSREQLASIYQALHEHEAVLWLL